METFSVIERAVSFKVFNARVSLYEIGSNFCLRHVVNLCSLPPNKFKIHNLPNLILMLLIIYLFDQYFIS